ncbi:hypothetical protein PHET_05611 [Paragonimus heterotremus]|uniref:Uncharacterized protein n=1 Tax=Paragonimus heterotremus TaxID=100268 RepID=A0A8J4TH18_9TREM|nr:hypothetical protein PHET_05611 [Paragonimus heterotremus]
MNAHQTEMQWTEFMPCTKYNIVLYGLSRNATAVLLAQRKITKVLLARTEGPMIVINWEPSELAMYFSLVFYVNTFDRRQQRFRPVGGINEFRIVRPAAVNLYGKIRNKLFLLDRLEFSQITEVDNM